MGIRCAVWQIVQETVDDLVKDPTIGKEVLAEFEEYNKELPEEGKIFLDLDKAWDGLSHLLLNKKIGPAPLFLKEGGLELEAIDVGYGHARVFDAEETLAILQAINPVTFDKLKSGVNAKDFIGAEIYPFHEGETDTQAFSYLEKHWSPLKKFLAATVEQGRGIMVYLF